MDSTDRTMIERSELGDFRSQRLLNVRNPRTLVILNAVLVIACVALSYAAAKTLDGWADFVVLAVIIVTTIGFIIALNTARAPGDETS